MSTFTASNGIPVSINSQGVISLGVNEMLYAPEADALREFFHAEVDWRVLGGVIPGPIPVEWVRVGDTIQDHGVTGTITRATRSGGMVHLAIGSGHVSFAKVAQQDFITVLSSNHEIRSTT